MKNNHKIKLATAFSGGLAAPEFALKYENIDHEVIFACEFDKYARKQYLEFHGEPNTFYEDIRDLDARRYRDKIDLFVFGSPCQNLSLAGNRQGFNGEKSSLFREGARVLKEMMPKVFIFENVKGLLSSNGGADYKEVIRTFQDLGYLIASKVLNAKEHGTAQNRERVFVVGFLNEDEYHSFNFEEPKPLTKALKDYLDIEVDEKYYLSNKMISYLDGKPRSIQPGDINTRYSPCMLASYHKTPTDGFYIKEPQLNQVGTLDIKGNDSIKRVYAVDGISPTLTTMGGGNREPKIYQTARGYNKGGEKEICPTITINSWEQNNRLIDSYKIRKLTPTECFRLQGVKNEDINLVNSDTQSYKIAGNAIEVNTMRSIIRALYKQTQRNDSLF